MVDTKFQGKQDQTARSGSGGIYHLFKQERKLKLSRIKGMAKAM